MFKKLTTTLVMLLVAALTMGVTSIGSKLPSGSDPGYFVDLTISNSVGEYLIGNAFPAAILGFESPAAEAVFAGELWACQTKAFVAESCDSITALAGGTDVASTVYTTFRMYYVLVISAAATGTNISNLVIKGTYDQVSEGGGGVGPASDIDTSGTISGRVYVELLTLGYDTPANPPTLTDQAVRGGWARATTNAATDLGLVLPKVDEANAGLNVCIRNIRPYELLVTPDPLDLIRLGALQLTDGVSVQTIGPDPGIADPAHEQTLCLVNMNSAGWISVGDVSGWEVTP